MPKLNSCGPECEYKRLNATQWSVNDADEQTIGPPDDDVDSIDAGALQDNLYNSLLKDQIRVLTVYPAQAITDRVCCDLLPISLHDLESVGNQYDALSYSWGYPVPSKIIECNGMSLPISTELHMALSHLRKADLPTRVWIDALCINQVDLDEKADQVGIMFRIFQRAARVVCWLGIPAIKHQRSLRMLHYREWTPKNALQSGLHDEACKTLFCQIFDELADFINHTPWFHRTWVRQEVAVKRPLHIICGKFQFSYQTLFHYLQDFDWVRPSTPKARDRDPSLLNYQEYEGHPARYSRFRNDYLGINKSFAYLMTDRSGRGEQGTQRHDWLYYRVILKSSAFGVTLSRDRVYALLGMINETTSNMKPLNSAQERFIRPCNIFDGFPKIRYDEGKSTSAVYQDLIKHAVNMYGQLDTICSFQARSTSCTSSSSLPSWVTDLDVDQLRIRMFYWSEITWVDNTIPTLPPQDYNDLDTLRLEGAYAGHITLQHQHEDIPDSPPEWYHDDRVFDRKRWPTTTDCAFANTATNGETWYWSADQYRHLIHFFQRKFDYKWVTIQSQPQPLPLSPHTVRTNDRRQFRPALSTENATDDCIDHKHVIYALAPSTAKQGDVVYCPLTSPCPWLLRKQSGQDNRYQYLGLLLVFLEYHPNDDDDVVVGQDPGTESVPETSTMYRIWRNIDDSEKVSDMERVEILVI